MFVLTMFGRRVVAAFLRDGVIHHVLEDRVRDVNGMRGPVPTDFRAHDWQTCRVLRVLADRWLHEYDRKRSREIARRAGEVVRRGAR